MPLTTANPGLPRPLPGSLPRLQPPTDAFSRGNQPLCPDKPHHPPSLQTATRQAAADLLVAQPMPDGPPCNINNALLRGRGR